MSSLVQFRLVVLCTFVASSCLNLNDEPPPPDAGVSTTRPLPRDAEAADRPMMVSTVDSSPGTVDPTSSPGTDAGCAEGFHKCGGECKDSTKADHCGNACDPCPTVAGGTATCTAGKCGVTCPAGKKPCLESCIDDKAACEGTCPDGKNACNGICVDARDKTACGAACTACPTSDNGMATCDGKACALVCNTGFHLCDQLCVPESQPCKGACVAGRKLCGGSCVDGGAITAEVCDGKDNDCNGTADDNVPAQDCSNRCTKATKICAEGKWDDSKCPASAVQCCTNTDCGTCQACSAGVCMNQAAGEDKKSECGGRGCNTGQCRTCTPNQKMCFDSKTLRTCSSDGARWAEQSCFNCSGQTCSQCAPKTETCDGADNDCDGDVDEGNLCSRANGTAVCQSQSKRCVNTGCNSGFRECGGKCEAESKFCGSGCTQCSATEMCVSGQCQPKCGGNSEPCCGTDNRCNGDLACVQYGSSSERRCGSCGVIGRPCCPGSSRNSACNGGICYPRINGLWCERCGGKNAICCPSKVCDAGLTCLPAGVDEACQ